MARNSGRRRMGGEEEAEESDERWLLTYADMITLLMALFMVLFSISSVNVSKFVTLQRSLQDAFSGRILPGGRALQESGGSTTSPKVASTPADHRPPPSPPTAPARRKADAKAAGRGRQGRGEGLQGAQGARRRLRRQARPVRAR